MKHVKPVIAEATARALCDSAYLHHRDHIDRARAVGCPSANGALRALPAMQHQRPRTPPIVTVG